MKLLELHPNTGDYIKNVSKNFWNKRGAKIYAAWFKQSNLSEKLALALFQHGLWTIYKKEYWIIVDDPDNDDDFEDIISSEWVHGVECAQQWLELANEIQYKIIEKG